MFASFRLHNIFERGKDFEIWALPIRNIFHHESKFLTRMKLDTLPRKWLDVIENNGEPAYRYFAKNMSRWK